VLLEGLEVSPDPNGLAAVIHPDEQRAAVSVQESGDRP
jgi:hypothetical protein